VLSGCPEVAVSPGRKYGVAHVAPPSVERVTPMSVAPPSKKRPTWKAETIVAPLEKVSGSTSVACWLVALVNGSLLIRVSDTLASAGAADTRAPAASARRTAPRLDLLKGLSIRATYSLPRVLSTGAGEVFPLKPPSRCATPFALVG